MTKVNLIAYAHAALAITAIALSKEPIIIALVMVATTSFTLMCISIAMAIANREYIKKTEITDEVAKVFKQMTN